jgi:hypothetical protein
MHFVYCEITSQTCWQFFSTQTCSELSHFLCVQEVSEKLHLWSTVLVTNCHGEIVTSQINTINCLFSQSVMRNAQLIVIEENSLHHLVHPIKRRASISRFLRERGITATQLGAIPGQPLLSAVMLLHKLFVNIKVSDNLYRRVFFRFSVRSTWINLDVMFLIPQVSVKVAWHKL